MKRTLMRTTTVSVVLLSAATLATGQNAPSSGDSGKPLGDIAKQARPKQAKVTTKHVFTDDDVAHGADADSTAKGPTDANSSLSDAQDVIDRTASLNSRQLGGILVGDIKFPGREAWEDKLYQQKQKLVGAAQTALDYAANKTANAKTDAQQQAAQKGLRELLFNLSWERTTYNRISSEGISQAAAWEKRSR
jgi:hypothetical protein